MPGTSAPPGQSILRGREHRFGTEIAKNVLNLERILVRFWCRSIQSHRDAMQKLLTIKSKSALRRRAQAMTPDGEPPSSSAVDDRELEVAAAKLPE
jgi:hypothetical protein